MIIFDRACWPVYRAFLVSPFHTERYIWATAIPGEIIRRDHPVVTCRRELVGESVLLRGGQNSVAANINGCLLRR